MLTDTPLFRTLARISGRSAIMVRVHTREAVEASCTQQHQASEHTLVAALLLGTLAGVGLLTLLLFPPRWDNHNFGDP